MNKEDILYKVKDDEEGLIVYTQFKQPYQTSKDFPLQYQYINQFLDILIKKIDYKGNIDKIGFVSDADGMKHFLSFILSAYDDYKSFKILESYEFESDENP